MSKSAIPDKLIVEMLQRSNDGYTHQEITDWLVNVKGVKTSITAVHRRIKEFKDVEQDAKKQAIAEAAAKSAVECVSIIDKHILLLDRETCKLFKSGIKKDKVLGNQLSNTLLKYIDKKMNLTGMDKEKPNDSDEELVNSLLKKIGE